MTEHWEVKTDEGLFEYAGQARTVGGALTIYMEEGTTMLWGPGAWTWAHNGIVNGIERDQVGPQKPQEKPLTSKSLGAYEYDLSGTSPLTCQVCGAFVRNTDLHDRFHDLLR